MARKTRRQLVGKQEDTQQHERDEELRMLVRELHLAWVIGQKDSQVGEIELTHQAVALSQAKTRLLTVHMRTM